MIAFVTGFASGAWWLQQQAVLPAASWFLLLPFVLLAAWLLHRLARDYRSLARVLWASNLVVGLILGFFWAAAVAQWRLADALSPEWEGRDVEVVGVISSLTSPFERGVRFDFAVEQTVTPGAQVPGHLALAWYSGFSREDSQPIPELRAGERWHLTLRLKRPHGSANPHTFDYEAFLLERGVRATGYIRVKGENTRLDEMVVRPGYVIERLRESIRTHILAALPEKEFAGVLVALVVGDQNAIDNPDWQVFMKTGVGHLMSISGLHITMLAGLGYAVMFWLWRRSPRLLTRLPAKKAAVIAGTLAALAYCLIAGFAVPAQRTLYMIAVVAIALWTGRIGAARHVLAAALFVVVLFDPWAPLSAGFWLSFGAVALIFYVGLGRLSGGVQGRFARLRNGLHEWGRVQWAITVGLTPMTLILFQQVSIVSPVANAIAIPVVSFVVTPLALAGALLPGDIFSYWLLQLAHLLFEWLMVLLEWLASSPLAIWQQHEPPLWAGVIAICGVAWTMLPRGFPARWLGAVLIAPLFIAVVPHPAPGEAWVTVLDVGQGLATTVRTATHTLVYDTGPRYSTDADGGNRVILPFLRGEGVKRVDGLVVSHNDIDHSGGAQSVLEALPVDWLDSSLSLDHPLYGMNADAMRCYAGQHWEWDGVRFTVLHPALENYEQAKLKTNDRSCVVRVKTAGGSVLLTGDIETRSEMAMLSRGEVLHSDVLLAPHHGSKTSSSPEFIAAVSAKTVIFPAGYRNRFGHPKEEVVERYRETGAKLLRTDREGAVLIRLGGQGVSSEAYRDIRPRYWMVR